MKTSVLSKQSQYEEMEIERDFVFDLNIKGFTKDESNKKRVLKGYAATTGKDRGDDDITIEALKKCKDDLLKAGSNTVFFNHNRNQPIGKVIATEIDAKGLIVHIEISKAKDCDDHWTKIQEKVLKSLSIGGRYKKVEVVRDDKGHVESFKILEMELYEVSVVGIPMNAKASILEAIEKGFKLKGKGKMKKTEASKTEVEVVDETVEQKIEKAVAPIREAQSVISKGLESLTASITSLAETVKKGATTEQKPEVKTTETKEVATGNADVLKAVADLTAKVEALTPKRKGTVETEEEETEEETVVTKSETPVACLEEGDEKTGEYVKWLMNTKAGNKVYEKMDSDDKLTVKNLWYKSH